MVNLNIESLLINGELSATDGGQIYIEHSTTVDDELSETSENPVQNKVITAALNGKVNIQQTPNTVLAAGTDGQVTAMGLGNALETDGENLSVKTVNEMEDSPLPMSAAGVHVIVGNIDTILSTI